MRVLIIGCGYVGLPLGTELVRLGHEVHGVRHSAGAEAELQAAGIQPHLADITKPEDLARIPGRFDWVVNCVSSSRGGLDAYRQVFLDGTENILQWLSANPPAKYVHVSSTSVYGQTDGSLVKESSPTSASSPTGQVLVQTENRLLDAWRAQKFPAILLRAAGIYGPERGYLFLQYLKNEARLEGKGERLINMIHRDDLAGVILAALKSGKPGEIYNAVDDEPVTQLYFFRWLSETLGKYLPPYATPDEAAARKRPLTHKKVSNRKVKMELGYQFKYPTFRQGYTAEIQRLDRAGQLDIAPDPR